MKYKNFSTLLEKTNFYDKEINSVEKYHYANDDDVRKISSRLIEKHKKAYIALADA